MAITVPAYDTDSDERVASLVFAYASADDYLLRYYNKSYDLNKIRSVDFIMVPFADLPQIAHVMLSFGFEDDEYVCVSVEIRRDVWRNFQAVAFVDAGAIGFQETPDFGNLRYGAGFRAAANGESK